MAVIAFVRPPPGLVLEPASVTGPANIGEAEKKLGLYGRAMRLCFISVLAGWVTLQAGCLLSLFLHFRSGIVAGTINGTIAFKFWPLIDYFSPTHALSNAFLPHLFPTSVSIIYAAILIVASAPFCASLIYLAKLFDLYSRGEVFSQRNVILMGRIGHLIMATGYSPLVLGPIAHAIGVLRPISGLTNGMIACMVVGLILLAVSHVMEIGQHLQQDQEDIL
jgi:hypothetical protein